MLTVCGYEAYVDEKNKTMKTKIGNTAVVLDAKTSTVSIDTTKIKLLVEPIFKDGQCYVSFNDLKNFIMIKHPDDAKNVSFFWESSETNELENKLKTLPTKHIYELTVGSDTYYKDDEPNKIFGVVYKKVEHIMIPIRTVAEMMISGNAAVSWNDDDKTAIIKHADKTYEFSHRTNDLKVDSVVSKFPAPLELLNGKLYIPAIDCLMIQYYMGNKMDTFDIYEKDENIIYIRM